MGGGVPPSESTSEEVSEFTSEEGPKFLSDC